MTRSTSPASPTTHIKIYQHLSTGAWYRLDEATGIQTPCQPDGSSIPAFRPGITGFRNYATRKRLANTLNDKTIAADVHIRRTVERHYTPKNEKFEGYFQYARPRSVLGTQQLAGKQFTEGRSVTRLSRSVTSERDIPSPSALSADFLSESRSGFYAKMSNFTSVPSSPTPSDDFNSLSRNGSSTAIKTLRMQSGSNQTMLLNSADALQQHLEAEALEARSPTRCAVNKVTSKGRFGSVLPSSADLYMREKARDRALFPEKWEHERQRSELDKHILEKRRRQRYLTHFIEKEAQLAPQPDHK